MSRRKHPGLGLDQKNVKHRVAQRGSAREFRTWCGGRTEIAGRFRLAPLRMGASFRRAERREIASATLS
jgi:hypothetical protein